MPGRLFLNLGHQHLLLKAVAERFIVAIAVDKPRRVE
jgi:hypothetical protein